MFDYCPTTKYNIYVMIIFSEHAVLQRIKRKISENRILETIKKPDESESSFRNRRLSRKKYGDKMLEVVSILEGENIIIITEYYLY